MLLAIDIGNTNVTLGLFKAGTLVATRRAATNPRASADEFEALLDALLRLDDASLADVSAIVAASVVPGADRRDSRPSPPGASGRSSSPPPARCRWPCGSTGPSEVGADRLVNALAAGRIYGTPAVVVDFGTATTFDCVAVDGAYVGGAIAPGLELGLEALAARTAKLPRIELRAPDRAIGRDTVSAMQSGTVFGYQALASGLLARIRGELAETGGVAPADVRAILTGGLSAAPWARALAGRRRHRPRPDPQGPRHPPRRGRRRRAARAGPAVTAAAAARGAADRPRRHRLDRRVQGRRARAPPAGRGRRRRRSC